MARILLLILAMPVAIVMQVGSAEATSSPHQAPEPMILQEGDGDHLVRRVGPTKDWPYAIKLDGQTAGTEDLVVMTEVMAPGQSIPFHKHDNAEEILFLEESGATVMVGSKWAVAGPRSIVFIPRNTWISATNTGGNSIHLVAVWSRHGFEQYMRAISARQGEPTVPVNTDDLPKLRAMGHAMYWDTANGPYPPGVAHP